MEQDPSLGGMAGMMMPGMTPGAVSGMGAPTLMPGMGGPDLCAAFNNEREALDLIVRRGSSG